jgi:ABC-type bacteriocin/lantibiotic exporter with double-glycine peptidase domain
MQASKSSKQRERLVRSKTDAAKKPDRPDPSKRRTYLWAYLDWLWPYRFTLAGVFALALSAAVLDLVWPLAIKRIIDGIVPG